MCFESYNPEDNLYRLPCKHSFHSDCILPWLDKHNTCPSCRAELPTDDLEYENRRMNGGQPPSNPLFDIFNQGRQGGNGGGAPGGSSSGGPGPSFNSSYHA